jgi:outer membrane receptor protein involved in Fe transport
MHRTSRIALQGTTSIALLALSIQVALAQAPAPPTPTNPANPPANPPAAEAELAQAQTPATPSTPATPPANPPAAEAEPDAKQLDAVVVVGSHIAGTPTTDALPVVVLDVDKIDASGAVSGDELLRTIPQMGDVLFDASNNPQTSNAARGDVNSINLRSLGVGNTLVLLNGRRLVQHPTSQGTSDTGTVPVQTFNSNSLPVAGIDRLEVLLDGAAAIYGADAVAGVVNTVMQTDFDGVTMSARYGGAEGTSMDEVDVNIFSGWNHDRGNISVFFNYTDRSALQASDQDFTAGDDLRGLFSDPDFSGIAALDGRSANAPWARLSLGTRPVIRSNGVAVTNTSGQFRVQPTSFAGCGVGFGPELCLASGALNFNTTNREMRYDTRFGTTVRPSVERFNLFLTAHHDLDNGIQAFGEFGAYDARSDAVQPPVVNLNQIWIPASNFWNPFGPVTFADGRANPNRLPGLTGVPTTGLPVQLTNYRYVDAGFQRVRVDNQQLRSLGGLRGEWRGFDWESALVYSTAEAEDRSPNINMTALQRQLALSTPDAYNPFSGGCTATPTTGDCSPSSQAAIDAIWFEMVRRSETTLAMGDLRLSRSDLFTMPAGDAGAAFGLEARRETQEDDRDSNLDGTFTFVDLVTGATNISNVAAVSPNPDTEGSRNVYSAYAEFALPLVSDTMAIPLVHRLDMQLAGRFEDYSDFGSVAKPKVAIAWDLIDGIRIRSSYSEGFRAPNLEQTNATEYARLATGVDHLRCEADLRAGRITNFGACTQAIAGASLRVSGNPNLEPEESTNRSIGLVLQPILPEGFGDFSFTVDRWRIEQEQIVGLLGAQTAITLDYLNRVEGVNNPRVIRDNVTPEDVTFFAGTGLTPVGRVIAINDGFINLLPQEVDGLDFGMDWFLPRTNFGTFRVGLNATRMLDFSRDPGEIVNTLFAARAAGRINPLTPLPDSTQLVGQNGRPEWRASSLVTWEEGSWRIGYSAQYMSSFEQAQLLGLSGQPWEVEDRLYHNIYGQFRFPDETRLRIGVRDLTDEGPPLADGGFRGSVHNSWGRYFYVDINRRF